MKALFALLLLAIAAPAQAAFDPVEFFRGRTHGEGTLKIIMKQPVKMSVDSEGFAEKDGSLLLKQIVHEPGKPARTRYWKLRKTGNNLFEGTLTDAAGPVRVDVMGALRSVPRVVVDGVCRASLRSPNWTYSLLRSTRSASYWPLTVCDRARGRRSRPVSNWDSGGMVARYLLLEQHNLSRSIRSMVFQNPHPLF